MYYFKNRYYSTTMGRFIHRDPIGYVDGLNLYALLRDNPLGGTDSFGLDAYSDLSPHEKELVERIRVEMKTGAREATARTKYLGPMPLPQPLPPQPHSVTQCHAQGVACAAGQGAVTTPGVFKICKREIQGSGIGVAIANAFGGGHTYFAYGDQRTGSPDRWGFGWGAPGMPAGSKGAPEGTFGATTCKTCERNTGCCLKYGTGKGKKVEDATTSEIQSCISNFPASKDYSTGIFSWYTCQNWAEDAAEACCLTCK